MLRYTLFFTCLLLVSCDSGDIYPEEKRMEETDMNISAVFHFENSEAFPQNYRIVWGAFVGTSPYPLTFEEVGKTSGKTWNAMPLKTVPQGTSNFLYGINFGGKKRKQGKVYLPEISFGEYFYRNEYIRDRRFGNVRARAGTGFYAPVYPMPRCGRLCRQAGLDGRKCVCQPDECTLSGG